MSAVEVTALSKHTFRNERYASKRIYQGCEGQTENPSLGITVWHHSASLVMPDSNPQDGYFYLHLAPMIDSYISHWRLEPVYKGMSCCCSYNHMSQHMKKPTIWPMWPAKTQISLYIHTVWQGFLFIPLWIAHRLEKAHVISEDSDRTAKMHRLSLCWSHKSYCRFCLVLAHIIIMLVLEMKCNCILVWYKMQLRIRYQNITGKKKKMAPTKYM